ncbi:MAG: hypothetical protein KJZ84_22485 [Bryobacteraceae bacterium]|nr:hypothetical protein [Bryobacteraceae bacterium]
MRAALSVLLSALLVQPLPAQQPQSGPRSISIVIVEGDGAINNVRQRIAREPIIEVVDENKNPVPGALVTFLLPQSGAGGVFTDGSRMLTVMTDDSGRAVARGIRTNTVDGQWQMRVSASFQGQTASATIGLTNAAVAGALAGAKLWALLAIIGGAAAGGAVIATRNGNGGAVPRPPTTVTPGTPSVQPPGN